MIAFQINVSVRIRRGCRNDNKLKQNLNDNEYINENIKIKRKIVRRDRCLINLHDLIFIKILMKKFRCLQIGTVISKAQNFAEIILLLDPPFMFNKNNLTNVEKLNHVRFIAARIFSMSGGTIEDRISKFKILDQINTTKMIEAFLISIETRLENECFSKFNVWNNKNTVDYVNGKYLTAFSNQVYFFDTIELNEKFELTMLTEASARVVVKMLITKNPPNSKELINMFREYFTPELKARCRIVHGDRTGSNMSNEVREYFTKENILLSHCTRKNKNQVAESVNKIIKVLIEKRNFEGCSEEITFSKLPHELKVVMVQHVIEVFNTMETSKYSPALLGYSREFIYAAKEIISRLRPDIINKSLVIGNSKSEKGEFISTWTRLVVRTYIVCLDQLYLDSIYGVKMPLINIQDLLDLQDICLEGSVEKLEIAEVKQNKMEESIKKILKICLSLKEHGLSKELIKYKLKTTLIEKIKKAKTKAEKEIAKYELNIIELIEKNDSEQIKNDIENIKEFKDLKLDNKEKIQSFNKHNILKRSLIKSMKALEDCAIMSEDFDVIMDVVDEMRDPYTRAKYRWAHIILKITGVEMGALMVINIQQIDNLHNKGTMFIRTRVCRTKPDYITLAFPYVPEMDQFLAYGEEDYIFLKKCQAENSDKLFKIDKNNPDPNIRERSEIWGYVSRSGFVTGLNEQIEKARQRMVPPKLYLTTKSYKKGVAISAIKNAGLIEANQLLGHVNMSSTESYFKKDLIEPKRLEYILSATHSLIGRKRGIYRLRKIKKNKLNLNILDDIFKTFVVKR
uniref:Uncharacterized protein n=1 Tax=Euglena viridis TaxID=3040 RepID=M1EWB5_EUGVI|nr:hypothetical protein I642_p061 [Euglena viridis]AEY70784.1 hypothetical protein [Euglena viridis]